MTLDLSRMRYLILISAFLAPAVFAQSDDPLPDLTPREFEIRGELQVSLPDLQRQPLEGFTPPPRTYVVPADRRAYTAAYGHDFSTLPHSPPTTPEPPTILRSQPRTGQIDMLAGRYLSRIGRLTLNAGGFGMNVGYSGFSGFEPLPDISETAVDANNVHGSIGYTTGNDIIFSITGDGQYSNFGYIHPFALSEISQTLSEMGLNLRLERVPENPQSMGFAFSARVATSDAQRSNNLVSDTGTFYFLDGHSEHLFAFNGGVSTGLLDVDFGVTHLTGDLHENSVLPLNAYSPHVEYPVTGFHAGAAAEFPLVRRHAGTLGLKLLGYTSALQDEVKLYPAPYIHAEMVTDGGIRLFATNTPEIRMRSQMDAWRFNPYRNTFPSPLPEVLIANAQAGLEIQNEYVRVRAYGLGRYAHNTPFSFRVDDNLSYNSDIHSTTQFGGGTDVTLYLGETSFSLGGEYRATRFIDPDDADLPQREVPFTAPLIGNATLAVPFNGTRGLIQSTMYLEGKRPTFNDEDAPAWANLSVEIHYRLAGRFALIARGDNLTGSAGRWPGFPRPPAIITGGIRAGW